MNLSAYQRFVFGYHGCDASVADEAIQGGSPLKVSENDYDWLGRGIYFWEHGPDRAFEWAEQKKKQGKVKKPAVVGALIHLGNCFDLLDTRHTAILPAAFDEYRKSMLEEGKQIPNNSRDEDQLRRQRDCALLNWLLNRFENSKEKDIEPFQTVRGVFIEGEPAFEGSGIRQFSHIQIAVRDPSCILGYFKPT